MNGTQIVTTTRTTEDVPLRDRIAAQPRPALVWAIGMTGLLLLEAGALLEVLVAVLASVVGVIPGVEASVLSGVESAVAGIPTLLDRGLIPNGGYYTGQQWMGTFLGLEPKYAWLIRVTLVYVYVAACLGWLWVGYQRFREHYRYADWTPRDDVIDRFSRHRWGQFGLIVVLAFVVLAVFAPTLGPTTVERNIANPYGYSVQYFDETTRTVLETQIGVANLQSTSSGSAQSNIGPWTYDDFGRFHPFGTLTSGKDLFTFMAAGARTTLGIGVIAITAAGAIGVGLALVTAYFKGVVDLAVVVISDAVNALPELLMLILAGAVFANTPIADYYNGALLITLIYIALDWPYIWRAVRGPALQVAEGEWVDAAKSYGQRPSTIMTKHILPYILGYALIYGSLFLGGVMIGVAALSFLGLGIQPPTPEWGQAVAEGRQYVATASWHISLIPGLAVTIVVIGFNAFGDGIRDALDPQSTFGDEESAAEGGSEVAAAGGGGG